MALYIVLMHSKMLIVCWLPLYIHNKGLQSVKQFFLLFALYEEHISTKIILPYLYCHSFSGDIVSNVYSLGSEFGVEGGKISIHCCSVFTASCISYKYHLRKKKCLKFFKKHSLIVLHLKEPVQLQGFLEQTRIPDWSVIYKVCKEK